MMLEKLLPVAIFVLPLAGSKVLHAQDAAASQSWTSKEGKTLQGQFVKVDGEAAVILRDGKEVTIPFARLTPESVEQAKKRAASGGTGPAPQATTGLSAMETARKGEMVRGEFGGIGAILKKEGDDLKITSLVPNGSAERANLKAGQIIRAINGEATKELTIDNAVNLLRGEVGSVVELHVVNPDSSELQTVRLAREAVLIPSTSHRILASNVGVLTIGTFTQQTPREVREILGLFVGKKVRGVVLDLRYSKGGVAAMADDVACCFLGKGKDLWQVRWLGNPQPQVVRGEQDQIWFEPVVVLVSSRTSGTSEMVATALQSNNRGPLLGQKTAGHGCIQAIKKKPDGTSERVPPQINEDPSQNARAWNLRTIQNACMETTLIAIRDLDDILSMRTKDARKRKDDLRVSDFGYPAGARFLSETERG